MTKYKQEVKDKCVEAAKNGQHLKSIQIEFGPNPKAVMRYLKKAGLDYTKMLADFKAAGKPPKTPIAICKIKAKEKKNAAKTPAKKVE